MRRLTICSCICVCICITVLLLALIDQVLALDQAQPEAQPKVLRVGFERTKPLNNLDMLDSKPTDNSNSEIISSQKPVHNVVHNVSMLFWITPKVAFNASQRTGMVAKFTYDTGIFKPFYNVSAYSNAKPIYDVPDSVHKKPVYNIENYPKIKAVNSIP